MDKNKTKKPQKPKAVKFLLAPRPQRDPLAADYEAPQNVLIPKDGTDIEEIRKRLPEFDPDVFVSKEETKVGMLERAHIANGVEFDPDILKAMSKDFDFNDPNNILDDDFMEQSGGLIEDDGELLEEDLEGLTSELFESEPEIIRFDQSGDLENSSIDSDDYDVDSPANHDNLTSSEPTERKEEALGYGRKLILFKKANKQSTLESTKSSRSLQGASTAKFRSEPHNLRTHSEKMQSRGQNDDSSSIMDDDDVDNKTVFTNYSMTSSVMRRSQGLQQIDEHFEVLFEKEYADDTEIGPLDLNEVRGDELLSDVEKIHELKREVKSVRKKNHGDDYEQVIVSDHHKNAIIGDDSADENDDLVEIEVRQRENRVDCESILSYNSNLYNHPKLIMERQKRSSSQSIEMDTSATETSKQRAQSIASSRASVLSKLSVRPENETNEERRARKKALKAYRHERRQERKLNQQIFKSEQAILARQQRNNLHALKLS